MPGNNKNTPDKNSLPDYEPPLAIRLDDISEGDGFFGCMFFGRSPGGGSGCYHNGSSDRNSCSRGSQHRPVHRCGFFGFGG